MHRMLLLRTIENEQRRIQRLVMKTEATEDQLVAAVFKIIKRWGSKTSLHHGTHETALMALLVQDLKEYGISELKTTVGSAEEVLIEIHRKNSSTAVQEAELEYRVKVL